MKQINKSLSGRDAVLLILLALVAVGVLYYYLVYRPTEERIAALQTQQVQVQTEIDTLNTKLELLTKMQNELPQLRADNKPVAPFDNSKPVMQALNNIMAPSQEFNITFTVEQGEEGEPVVRRLVNIEFLCANYASAKGIIGNLVEVPFRCQIGSTVLMSDGTSELDEVGDLSADPIRGTVSIAFFEAA